MCKKWCRIISNPQAWSVINFHDKIYVDEYSVPTSYFHRFVSKTGKTCFEYRGLNALLLDMSGKIRWKFPTDEIKVCDFLILYAGAALKEVYLHINSSKIMNILRQNCPNIQTLCYFEGDSYKGLSNYIGKGEVEKKLYFPPGLKHLIYQQPGFFPIDQEAERVWRDEEILSLISKCRELEKLTLYQLHLSKTSMQILTENTKLTKIELLYSLTSILEDLDDILTASVGRLTRLRCFRLHRTSFPVISLRSFFECILHWEHLQVLALRGGKMYDDETFEMLVPGLLNLRMLQLEGPSVTSKVVSLIGNHLKRLEYLELENGSYSSKSLQALAHHPTLKTLSITCNGERERQQEILHDIYDVLVTLSSLQYVLLRGHKISQIYYYEKFPKLELAEIEVQDMDRPVEWKYKESYYHRHRFLREARGNAYL